MKKYIGIELGSTRIKSVLLDENYKVVASGGYGWENRYENGYFTYPLEEVKTGLQASFASLSADYTAKTGEKLTAADAIGISAMMHGYLVFDKELNLLTPFRTWRNAKSKQASDQLTQRFNIHIPQRWSVSNLYQAMLDKEAHVKDICYLTTLSGYIHMLLTGRNEVGLCEASGMFPVTDGGYDKKDAVLFDETAKALGYDINILSILPQPRPAGHKGAFLTEEGARFLDPTGTLEAGIPLCAPEGDAATGMVATNSVKVGTGSVSAGTSVFAQIVTGKPLSRVYKEADVLKTPDGAEVVLIHSTNGCSEIDKWVSLFDEFAVLCGVTLDKTQLYTLLYNNTKNAAADCGGVTAYNCISSEPIVHIDGAYPMIYRSAAGEPDLANLIKAQICGIFAPVVYGMDILRQNEGIKPECILAHGGLFKIPGVAQKILADALDTPVSVMSTAGEGGAYGMALLAAYMTDNGGLPLALWLDKKVFAGEKAVTLYPDKEGAAGYKEYMKNYVKGLDAVRALS